MVARTKPPAKGAPGATSTSERSAATGSWWRPKRPGQGASPATAAGRSQSPPGPRKAALSPSAAASGWAAAKALRKGKSRFQWPQRSDGASHMWLPAVTARAAGSKPVSRKSFWNSRRGAGATPQFHSRKAVSASRWRRPSRLSSSTRHSSTVAAASTSRVQRAPTPPSAVSKVVQPSPWRHR